MALTYDQVTAITRKHWMKNFPQLVFDQNLVQKRLHESGSKPRGGTQIMQPVKHQASVGGAYSPFDTFDVSAQNQFTSAVFDWKYYEWPITLSRDEILKNEGPEGFFNLLNHKVDLAKMMASDELATDMFRVITSGGTYDNSEKINSLDHALDDDSTTLNTSATFGGIDRSDGNTFWNGTLTTGGGTGVAIDYAVFNEAFMDVADGAIQPDLIVMHNNAFEKFMNDQQGQQRYMKQTDMDSGFMTAMINGKTVVADLHVNDTGTTTEADNRVYFLNTKFLDFVTHRDENMRLEPFAKPIDQAVMVAHIMWAGELTASDPSRSCVLHTIDTAE